MAALELKKRISKDGGQDTCVEHSRRTTGLGEITEYKDTRRMEIGDGERERSDLPDPVCEIQLPNME